MFTINFTTKQFVSKRSALPTKLEDATKSVKVSGGSGGSTWSSRSSRAVFELFEAEWTDFADLALNDPGGSADRPWVSKERRTKGILTDPCQYKICLVSILSQIVW